MKVKEIMSKDIASVKCDDTAEYAAQLMRKYNCGSIPVCCDGKVKGIITDRDIALRCMAQGKNIRQQKVDEIMSADPAVGNPEMDVQEAAQLMGSRQIRRLPIAENGRLVGIVALGDISVEPQFQDSAGSALKNISRHSGTI